MTDIQIEGEEPEAISASHREAHSAEASVQNNFQQEQPSAPPITVAERFMDQYDSVFEELSQ